MSGGVWSDNILYAAASSTHCGSLDALTRRDEI